MSRRQWKRLDAVERIVVGKLSRSDAAAVLGLSERQVRRLVRAFEKQGAAGLVHGNRGRAPSHKVSVEIRRLVVELMTGKYVGFNEQHFTEKLAEEEDIVLSRQSVRRILRASGVKASRRRRAKRYRQRRERKAQEGMMLLWDGSRHDWLEGRGPQLCLMAAIDDATGAIMPGAHFVLREGTRGYLHVLLAVAQKHGLPHSIYMDRHSSLHRNDDGWTLAEELRGVQDPTQVGEALAELGVEPIFALSPEAKGRVERLWGTLQDRLCSELRLAKVSTLEQANEFIQAYLAVFNARFARPASEVEPAWRRVPRGMDVEAVCSHRYRVTVARNNTVSVNRYTVDIPPSANRVSDAGKKADVRFLLDGRVRVYLRGELAAEVTSGVTQPGKRHKRRAPRGKQESKPKLTFKEIVNKHRKPPHRTESLAS